MTGICAYRQVNMDKLQDRHIIGLIQSDPERGFRMLINRYKETV